MKGTFFSADFVRDNDNKLRLIEVNTDTGITEPQKNVFDWTNFISILSANSITNVNVVFKYDIQFPIVESLYTSLTQNAPFITGFTRTIVPGDSIFPTSPDDTADTFILRMAYDETAILDSEYAKGTLNLLKLYSDNNDNNSVVGFYHSSSAYGVYNTIETSLNNPSNVPDFVSKTVNVGLEPHNFYKLGHSTSNTSDRINDFLTQTNNSDIVIEQYHINSQNITNNMVTSIRSFHIVYGSNLDLCNVAEYEINATFNIPGSLEFSDSDLVNLVPTKHYYEYSTNFIKNINAGFLSNEKVMTVSGSAVTIADANINDYLQSYYVDGAPNTDDFDVLRLWNYSGGTLPSGSYVTSSYIANKFSSQTFANDIISINFVDGAQMYIGGETRVLTYDTQEDNIRYVKVLDLDTDDAIFASDGSHVQISSIDNVIFNNQQEVWEFDMQEIHNFILETNNFLALLVVHNVLSCFPAGTQITLGNGEVKNIEDIEVGDEVISFNEETSVIESKKVTGIKSPIHNDLVKYHFSNDTTLTCTFDHPIYVNGLDIASFIPEWTNERYEIGKNVEKIKVGDLVKLSTGSQTAIKEIQILPFKETQTYIFEVEDNHNFFANGVLVHNK